MKLHTKLLLSLGAMLLATFALIEIIGYQQTRAQLFEGLRGNALEIRGVMMATRRVYQAQFVESELPLNDKTVGFLPAHAMSRISDEFLNWGGSGLSFNNVSDQPRNPANQADAIELEAIAYFRQNPQEQERLIQFAASDGRNYFHFSSPIWTEPQCLECHGEPEDAPETIREAYSTAFYYKVGDLRGLMSIKLPTDSLETEVLQLRLREIGARISAFVAAFLFGWWLIRYQVTRRLNSIRTVADELATGNYAARVPISGSDELCQLAGAFNNMAEQRRKAEYSRREVEQQVRDLLDSTAEGIFGLDRNGRCTIVNPSCLKLLGYASAEELIGRDVHPLIHHTNADGSVCTSEQCRVAATWSRGEAVHTVEDLFWRSDGESFPVELSSSPIYRDGALVGAVVTFLDISNRLKGEEKLRRAQKMEAVGQLTGGIAHDFNNMLSIILGNLDMLQPLVGENRAASKRVDTITKAAVRATDLTKQLLGFARRETKQQVTSDLNELIQEMQSLIKRSVTPAIEVRCEFEPGLWSTDIDQGDFQDALLNLIINARDALPDGGLLKLRTANRHLSASDLEENVLGGSGDFVELSVIDNGNGIAPDLLDRIFDPFFTTKSKGEGTGLGLSLVYGFVQRSKGQITVDSNSGKGSIFSLFLPRSQSGSVVANEPLPSTEELPTGTELVLIVDDEPELASIASQYLETQGYRTLIAQNGVQAMELLHDNPAIELLFSDVVMPGGMSGYELVGQARALHPQLKVLLVSGFSDSSAISQQKPDDVVLLSKPYSRGELLGQVRALLDS